MTTSFKNCTKKRHLLPFPQVITLLCALIAYSVADAGLPDSIVMKLWPTVKSAVVPTERALPSRGDGVRRITDITEPSLTVYRVGKADNPTAAVLVFPGGAYAYLAVSKEGTEIAAWLNSIGITAVVVKYRVPDKRQAAFMDGGRAMRLVRHHAGEWNIDPERVGVIGFSAGGHLSARLSTDFKNRIYVGLDSADLEKCRPDFCILVYPAYLMNTRTHKLANELPVTPDVPPIFIVQTKDDTNYVAGTIAYDQALRKVGVSSTFHLFPEGGHGYGLWPSKYAVSGWPKLCEEWLKENAIISGDSNKSTATDDK
jgi:acetyl esterase/lipase